MQHQRDGLYSMNDEIWIGSFTKADMILKHDHECLLHLRTSTENGLVYVIQDFIWEKTALLQIIT